MKQLKNEMCMERTLKNIGIDLGGFRRGKTKSKLFSEINYKTYLGLQLILDSIFKQIFEIELFEYRKYLKSKKLNRSIFEHGSLASSF